jgi:shikimate kinase
MAEGHVVLVGLMGTGKSTVGRALAERLGRPHVDTDAAIVERSGGSIAELFERAGEPGMRALEADVLADALAGATPTVVSAGGGVVVTPVNRERLADPAVTVVWLRAAPAFLADLQLSLRDRPLLRDGAPLEVFTRLERERGPWFTEVADVVLDIETYERPDERPRRGLVDDVADAVLAHESQRVAT